jgi:tRNA uridine 5-carboxymethylaminomethyl modification enzyme
VSFSAGHYDVIVIGAGHAGSEACLAAARLGCKTLCLTISRDAVAMMPCNPAVGGPGKGHLVREVDALGGQIGINADRTYLQIRMLNTGKGPAVRALRCQSDKMMYQLEMISVMEEEKNLQLKQAMVEEILVKNGRVQGVRTQTGAVYWAPAVVIASGTYLRGRVIIGDVNYSSGPAGHFPSIGLAENLKALGLNLVRFKTGTPARVDGNTVDFSLLEEQRGEDRELYFSYLSRDLERPNIPCWLTYTNRDTHEIINRNLERSPLFSGVIEGVGPRYCPSIESKVVRFAGKEKHQVFLEPEGLHTREMYVQGMSTSLPEDVQLEMLRTIKGLEKVEMTRPGYAIEYDCLVPTQLTPGLEFKGIEGLFCAGQFNGTSGYEEAAAQGIVAGINAARKVKGEPEFTLGRADGYIGVLIDDLVFKGTEEPYRILTSRAEYRLLLRHDNADMRLTEIGRKIGLVSDERYEAFLKKKNLLEETAQKMEKIKVGPGDKTVQRILAAKEGSPLKKSISLAELFRRPELTAAELAEVFPEGEGIPREIFEEVLIEIKYTGYLEKQALQVERFKRMEGKKLPRDLDYSTIKGLRVEAQEKLNALRPDSVGQASRISGVSPADISVLLIYLESLRRKEQGK